VKFPILTLFIYIIISTFSKFPNLHVYLNVVVSPYSKSDVSIVPDLGGRSVDKPEPNETNSPSNSRFCNTTLGPPTKIVHVDFHQRPIFLMPIINV